jgi:hypothetical protein
MPKIKAYGPVFRDWEGLLGAVERNASLLPAADLHMKALQEAMARAKEMKLQQEDLIGKRRASTQAFKQILNEGDEAARKLRALIIATLGSQTELLRQFGISNRRRKSVKTAEPLPKVETPNVDLAIQPTPPANPGGGKE